MGISEIDLATTTAILLAWDGLLRVSEYLPQECWATAPEFSLLRRDVERVRIADVDGYRIRLKRSKSDQYNTGSWHYFARRDGDPLCAVTALDRYLRAYDSRFAQSRGNWPLFIRRRLMARSGLPPFVILRADDISSALKRAAIILGVDSEFLSTHSLRIGGAFALADAGCPIPLIQQRGRWSEKGSNEIALAYTRLSAARLLYTSSSMVSASSNLLDGRR